MKTLKTIRWLFNQLLVKLYKSAGALNAGVEAEQVGFVTRKQIADAFKEWEGSLRTACYLHNLPYMELIPSLKGYALIQLGYIPFIEAYINEVRRACRCGDTTVVVIT